MKKILLILALVFSVGAFACSDLPSDLGENGVAGLLGPGDVEIRDAAGSMIHSFPDIPDTYITIDDESTTMSNYINACAGITKNHGQYVSCIARRTQALVKKGLLTSAQRTEILVWVAQSDLPY